MVKGLRVCRPGGCPPHLVWITQQVRCNALHLPGPCGTPQQRLTVRTNLDTQQVAGPMCVSVWANVRPCGRAYIRRQHNGSGRIWTHNKWQGQCQKAAQWVRVLVCKPGSSQARSHPAHNLVKPPWQHNRAQTSSHTSSHLTPGQQPYTHQSTLAIPAFINHFHK